MRFYPLLFLSAISFFTLRSFAQDLRESNTSRPTLASNQTLAVYQAAIVSGTGADLQLAPRIRVRAGFTMDTLKASTYSDTYYRSSWTVMVESRIGLIYNFGLPRRN